MYTKIMVPLDGSKLAECVLPHVEAFIKRFNVRDLFLVRVVESDPKFDYLADFPDLKTRVQEFEETKKASGKDYLDDISKRLKHERTAIHSEVLLAGKITESLIEFAEKSKIDLIVIATHGRSGVTRWIMGSVADKLLRSASVPVFMVRASEDECAYEG